ncbi:MAG: hypothetical protein WCA17_16690 [Burkholderiales bacterium]
MKLDRKGFRQGLRLATVAFALLAQLGIAHAADEWTMEERTSFAMSSVLLVADWAQTRQVARNPDALREINPILGTTPSMGRVNAYFGTALLLNYVIGNSLAPGWRRAWFVSVGTVEANVVQRNLSIGLNVSF